MRTVDAISFAGGRPYHLRDLFIEHGEPISKQAINRWVRTGEIPARRILQLQKFKPQWFKRSAMASIKNFPKPKRQTTEAIEKARKARGKPTKLNPKGPPFRARVNGDPEEKL